MQQPDWFEDKSVKEIKSILKSALEKTQSNIDNGDGSYITSKGKGGQSHYKTKLNAITDALTKLGEINDHNQNKVNNLENENNIKNDGNNNVDVANKQQLAKIYNDVRTALSKKWNWFGISAPQSLKTFDNKINEEEIKNNRYKKFKEKELFVINDFIEGLGLEKPNYFKVILNNSVLIKNTTEKDNNAYIEHTFTFPPTVIREKDQKNNDKPFLLLKEEDFKALRTNFHGGAFGCFGRDYKSIEIDGQKFVYVCKYPADLQGIGSADGGVNPCFGKNLPVGNYNLLYKYDNRGKSKIKGLKVPSDATKLRNDILRNTYIVEHHGTKYIFNKTVGIHKFSSASPNILLQGIGVSPYFVKDFNNIKSEEYKNLDNLVLDLEKLGLIVSNSAYTHHALVFVAYKDPKVQDAKHQYVTPKLFKELLNGPKREAIIEVMKNHLIKEQDGTTDKDVANKFDDWLCVIKSDEYI